MKKNILGFISDLELRMNHCKVAPFTLGTLSESCFSTALAPLVVQK